MVEVARVNGNIACSGAPSQTVKQGIVNPLFLLREEAADGVVHRQDTVG